ncbi:hypothetical protein LIER_14588 [Lithospermum erythrorhizon]|uniref:Uncharacterized protein n=1 Tax=Lithospermum erythrorhizon TaxID=34254 RepID=A0AAV3Q042_LITER
MHQRINVILNNLQSLGKEFTGEEINGKVFEALIDDYDAKICASTKTKDIGTIPLQELIGSLKVEEEVIAYKKAKRKNKKSFTRVAAKAEKMSEMDDNNDDKDDIAMLAKNFKKILKFKNRKSEYPQRSKYDNYEKRSKTKEYVSYKNNKSKKYTWEDDVTKEGSDSEVEIANVVCLMANDSMEVTFDSDFSYSFECSSYNELECACKNYSMTYTELNEANDCMLDDYVILMDKCKELSLNNKCMTTRIS